MIQRSEVAQAQRKAVSILENIGVILRSDELENIEVADFGLSELWTSGMQILTIVNTERITVKLLVLFPGQIMPEHMHPPRGNDPGKEETIRCEWGDSFLYGPGESAVNPKGKPPIHRCKTYTVWKEYHLHPGDQITFLPNTPHWFQAGNQGCVMWSFSTKAEDISDIFTDPVIQRVTIVKDD